MPLQNPFHTLYLTEGVGEVEFPSLFSPVLIPHVTPLFLPGNVVIKGMQGSGKSMLLSLLDTSVRLQFWQQRGNTGSERVSTSDPLLPSQRRFIGAGINLSKSNAFRLRGIRVSQDPVENGEYARQCFSDFINCWVLRDLLDSIEKMIKALVRTENLDRLHEIGLSHDLERLNAAITSFGDDSACSFLAGLGSVEAARRLLSDRIEAYKQLITSPRNRLTPKMEQSRKILGEPLTAATKALRASGVLEESTNVFITLDQFETLERKTSYPDDEARVLGFIRTVDELIAGRERAVSYRLGTRPNASLRISEESRDYSVVNLDLILQRKEHGRRGRNDLFYRLAEDAFRRRIATSDLPDRARIVGSPSPLRNVFGKSPGVAERGELVAPKRRERAIVLDTTWPADVREALKKLSARDVISARLGEAWVRQRLAKNEEINPGEWATSNEPPWETESKRWWKKERLALAALQVAAKNSQRLQYFGDADIVLLSGENILVFVSICREIWECDARFSALQSDRQHREVRTFSAERQAEGIRDASRSWRDKAMTRPDGDTLQRLLDELGKRLHTQLIQDRSLSYPGANGISLAKQAFEDDRQVMNLFYAATAEGFLLQRDHTPKDTRRGKSIKWYTHPILAPYYELTVQHTKEPLYLSVKKLRSWLEPHVLVPLAADETEKAAGEHKRVNKNTTQQNKSTKQQKTFGFDGEK